MSDTTLQEKLRIKSSMIFLGERIAFGSECELMDLAADCIDHQQAEIERLKGQRDRLYKELKEARDEVANQASAAHELLPYKPHRYEAYKDQLDRIDALIAEIEASK